jgi:23S rRNA (adenine2503-C2)-methyltransferase
MIYDLTDSELSTLVQSWGEPTYRARQIWEGLYHQFWQKPGEFTNLPISLRNQLESEWGSAPLRAVRTLNSSDGQTQKTLFELQDGFAMEAVLMSYRTRRTLCISTQVGCAMGCVFCATGQMGFKRHLSSGEIVAQVMHYARSLRAAGERVTNIVIMGMGEPFHNYDAVMAAIDRLGDPHGFNLGARRVTISTAGLVPGIRRFTAEKRQVNLAVSLHSAEDADRVSMMPINKRYPIDELLAACREYVQQTGRRITFEWALIDGINDGPDAARRLAARLKGLLCHVNAIPLNPTTGYAGSPTSPARAAAFRSVLERAGVPCTIRVRRGIDIRAGCGQLAVLSVL